MKMKWIAIFIIIAGLSFLGIGGYQYFDAKAKEKKSLALAQSVVANNTERDQLETSNQPDELPVDFQNGDPVGIISIPELDGEWPIVEGTGDEDLQAGVGHYNNTGYPTQGKQIFLAGHRDTVFSELGDLVEGDLIEIQMSYGTFQYEVIEVYIVGADDRTVIDYSIEQEVLTLCTCYPFRYIGSAPDRYIINAKPVNDELSG